jgi:A/G-specific adenine glycosylase
MTAEHWATGDIRKFRSLLLRWFAANKRDLPWRRTQDPYKIWISEIMLQQTRVAAVLEHYAEFLRRFPTAKSLAAAPEADVLAVWSGLGYYRRARMLHRGAQAVTDEFGGVLPGSAQELHKLPGIGAYTSAAIASIAFGEAEAAVDGNVERVITRIAGLSSEIAESDAALRPRIRSLADRLLDPLHPGDFNQAMMELGATTCLPRNPLCLQCPVASLCQTRGEHLVEKRKPMLSREVAYALVLRNKPPRGTQVLLHQRSAQMTVMSGMWELPEIAVDAYDSKAAEISVRHAIMQTNYLVRVHAIEQKDLNQSLLEKREECWAEPEQLVSLPLTGLARKVLRRVGLTTASRVHA